MQEPLQQALIDIVSLLEAHGARFALIGGLAVSLRAEPRFTRDVDIVVASSLESGFDLLGSLSGSRFRPLFEDAEELAQRSFIIPLTHVPTGTKVDVALGLSGFEHQAVERAEVISYSGHPVPVVTAEDLLLLKVLASRPRDHDDALQILLRQGPHLDWNYLNSTAVGLDDALAEDISGRLRVLRTEYARHE